MSGVLLTGLWVVLAVISSVIGLVTYLIPTIVAFVRHVPNIGSVAVVNVLLGWTLIGWIVALALALRSATQPAGPVTVIQNAAGGQPPLYPPSPYAPPGPVSTPPPLPPGGSSVGADDPWPPPHPDAWN